MYCHGSCTWLTFFIIFVFAFPSPLYPPTYLCFLSQVKEGKRVASENLECFFLSIFFFGIFLFSDRLGYNNYHHLFPLSLSTREISFFLSSTIFFPIGCGKEILHRDIWLTKICLHISTISSPFYHTARDYGNFCNSPCTTHSLDRSINISLSLSNLIFRSPFCIAAIFSSTFCGNICFLFFVVFTKGEFIVICFFFWKDVFEARMDGLLEWERWILKFFDTLVFEICCSQGCVIYKLGSQSFYRLVACFVLKKNWGRFRRFKMDEMERTGYHMCN